MAAPIFSFYNLIISGKERTPTDSTQLPLCFRQIENWANNLQWITPTLTSPWTNFGFGFAPLQYLLDPFGFVKFQGGLFYTGTLMSGTDAPVFNLPPAYTPPFGHAYPARTDASASSLDLGITVLPSGLVQVENGTGSNIANFFMFFDVVSFAMFR